MGISHYYYIFKKRRSDLSGGEIKKDFSPESKKTAFKHQLKPVKFVFIEVEPKKVVA